MYAIENVIIILYNTCQDIKKKLNEWNGTGRSYAYSLMCVFIIKRD